MHDSIYLVNKIHLGGPKSTWQTISDFEWETLHLPGEYKGDLASASGCPCSSPVGLDSYLPALVFRPLVPDFPLNSELSAWISVLCYLAFNNSMLFYTCVLSSPISCML